MLNVLLTIAAAILMVTSSDAIAGPAMALMGAVGSISAGLAIPGLMGGLMIAGGVMSGLGAITGNKTLSQLGMVAGLAGGVGQFFKTGGFDAYGKAFEAGGVGGVADQFTGAADYGGAATGYEGADFGYGMGAEAAAPSAAQQIVNTPTIGAADQSFGIRTATGGGLPGIESVAAAAPALSVAPAAKAIANAATQTPKGTGLLGLWENSGDFTKMAMVNAASGAVGGMAEADNNEKLLALKERQLAGDEKLTAAQTAVMEKKAAGVPMVSVNMGSNTSGSAYGKHADGTARNHDEYVADRADAMRRLFGAQPQTASA